MRLVAHHDNVMVGIDRLGLWVVELLNEREDERRIAFQFLLQVLPAAGDELLGLHVAQQSAVLERVADLLVQLITVGQYQECRRALKLAPNLL